MTTTPEASNALRRYGFHDTGDLDARVTTDTQWLDTYTDLGTPAAGSAEWTEVVVDAHGEVGHEPRFINGTFDQLAHELRRILDRPDRSADRPISVDISAWALHYAPLIAA
ncbi:hypothetical protein ACWEQ4_01440 [Rhodococcus sp. NPDC003994]